MRTDEPGKPSAFQKLADTVSYAMGTPANIIFWLVAVAIWVALGPYIAGRNFLPGWFTSQSFNFPLNTVTTIAELYIGFLVGASTNRSERDVKATLRQIANQERQIKDVEEKLARALELNTQLTREVRELATLIHEKVSAA
jgi:low affinity Fe/Cu permease